MRIPLNDSDVKDVNGGTVIISKDYMVVGFDTLGEMYHLQNCTYREARDLRDDMIDANPQMSNKAFDELMKREYQQRGWLGNTYQ